MKLGLGLELYRAKHLDVPLDLVTAADRLGFHSVWTAEADGADALSPLAFFAAHTSQIKLATGVVQVSARTPAATAMHALTIDQLAGGDRVIIGLGVSGPQIVEGWYGQPWGSPNRRLRDYVSIMRQVVDREAPVEHRGAELSTRPAGCRIDFSALPSPIAPGPSNGNESSAPRCSTGASRSTTCRRIET